MFRMKRTARVCKVVVALVVAAGARGAYGAPLWSQLDPGTAVRDALSAPRSSANGPAIITYSEDVPCKPNPLAVAPRPPFHRVRRRRIVHRVVVRKPAPIVRRLILHRAALHKAIARKPRRHPRLAPVAATPAHCVVLRSERLDRANLVPGAFPNVPLDVATPFELAEAPPDVTMIGESDVLGNAQGAAPLAPNSIIIAPPPPMFFPGGPGGRGTMGSGPSIGPVGAAPEPQIWLLMSLGVGLCGAALRRARRTAAIAT